MTASLLEAATKLRAWLRDDGPKDDGELLTPQFLSPLLNLAQDVAAALDALEAGDPPTRRIQVESIVKSRDLEPAVVLNWGEEIGELTPAEARAHALVVIETAEGAEGDAFLMHFLHTRVGLPVEHAAQVLKDFREWREQRAAKTEAELQSLADRLMELPPYSGPGGTARLIDLLGLVCVTVTPAQVEKWSRPMREEAVRWASAAYLHASDHDDVPVPQRPSFLPGDPS